VSIKKRKTMRIRFFISYIILVICFYSSCSPQQRIARIAKKYNLASMEIVTVKDTVILPEKTFNTVTYIDTGGQFAYLSDSVVYQGYIKDSLVYLNIKIPADTVYTTKEIPVEKIKIEVKEKPQKLPIWSWLFFALFGFVTINYIIQKIRKYNV